MEIPLPVSELKAALPGLARVVNKSAALPALQSIRVTQDVTGAIQLQATDLDTFAAYRFTSTPSGPAAEWLVPFEPLGKTIKGCAATDQILLKHAGNRLTLRYPLAGRPVEQPLEVLDPGQWPAVPPVESPSQTLEDPLKTAVHQAFACCSEERSRAALCGAWLDVTDPQAHYVMGTDGRHLYSANSFTLPLPQSLLLPHTRFLLWPGFAQDGPWKLALQPGHKPEEAGWLQLQSDRWTFITRRPDPQIPNWRQVVPASGSARVTVTFSPAATAFLLEVLPKLPGKDELCQPLRFEVTRGRLTLTARDRKSEHPTTLPVEDVGVVGPDIVMTVNRTFPLKALQFGLTVMEMTDELSPLVFCAPGRRLVAMPIRTETTPASPAASGKAQPPASPQPQPKEEPMPRTARTPTPPETAPEPRPLNHSVPLNGESKSAVKSVLDQLDALKESLKAAVRQCGDLGEALRLVEKEKKTSDREIESVRDKLRALRNVTL